MVLEIADVVLIVFVVCLLAYSILYMYRHGKLLFYFALVTVVNFPERQGSKLELQ